MKNFKVVLTEEELSNALVFLSRVDLKGNEVPAFVDIVNKLKNTDKYEDDSNGL